MLIVVPNSMRLVWADELEKWVPDLEPGSVAIVKHGTDIAPLHAPETAFAIVTYGLLTRNSPVAASVLERRFKV